MTLVTSDLFTLEPCQDCPLPGYVILSCTPPQPSLGELSPAHAAQLGQMLSKTAQAIETAVGAERVYVLSFCEVNRNLHFHLFPRTAWLRALYEQETHRGGQPTDGPKLVDWAREKAKSGGIPVPQGEPDLQSATHRLSNLLATLQQPLP